LADTYSPRKYKSYVDLVSWEGDNLVEMFCINSSDKLQIGKLEYMKKEMTLFKVESSVQNFKWSPQGKFLTIAKKHVFLINFRVLNFGEDQRTISICGI
jgi:hypothetical protein